MRLAAGLRHNRWGAIALPPDFLAIIMGREGRKGKESVGNRGKGREGKDVNG